MGLKHVDVVRPFLNIALSVCGVERLLHFLVSPGILGSDEQAARGEKYAILKICLCLLQMATNVTMSESNVTLGFLEEAESWQLLSNQFPSKVGGRPAWLSQLDLPSLPELLCEKCKLPTVFLLQVYAPIPRNEQCFHRTLFVFCCKTPACYTRNDSKCFKGNH